MTDAEKTPEDLKMKLFNLHCDANLNKKFPETNPKSFTPSCQKKKKSVLPYFRLRIITVLNCT